MGKYEKPWAEILAKKPQHGDIYSRDEFIYKIVEGFRQKIEKWEPPENYEEVYLNIHVIHQEIKNLEPDALVEKYKEHCYFDEDHPPCYFYCEGKGEEKYLPVY